MIFSKNTTTVAFIFASFLSMSCAFAQDKYSKVNESKPVDTLLLAMNTISLEANALEALIEAPSAIPASKLYHNKWNNKDIRMNNDKMFDKNATYILSLVNEGDSKFVFPYKGKVISPFGFRGRRVHAGTDIKLSLNDEVVSAFDGIVRMAKRYSGYGNIVVIRHANGLETCYSHLNKIKVKVNQEVKAGDLIGLGGRTGRATTTHLHFETRFLGDAFDSSKLLDYENFTLKSDTLVIDRNTFMKTKKYVYKKNKKGKRYKVYINDDEKNETTPINNNTVITYKEASKLSTDTTSITSNELVNESVNNKIILKAKVLKSKKSASYKVRNGDTLSRIAQRNGTTVKALCKLNKIGETAILSLGKKIKLK